MKEVIAGIEEGELGALSLEVMDYASRISDIFDRIDACMDKLPSCYQGPPCRKIMDRYRAIQASYPMVKENITSYSDDFITLIKKMRENDKYLAGLYQGLTNDTNAQIRTENFSLK